MTPFMIGFWGALGAICAIAVVMGWSLVALGVIASLARFSGGREQR